MNYKIVRIDGKEDDVTSQTFSNFADAYDLLNEIYGDICCSDADYGDIIYYDIVEAVSYTHLTLPTIYSV